MRTRSEYPGLACVLNLDPKETLEVVLYDPPRRFKLTFLETQSSFHGNDRDLIRIEESDGTVRVLAASPYPSNGCINLGNGIVMFPIGLIPLAHPHRYRGAAYQIATLQAAESVTIEKARGVPATA